MIHTSRTKHLSFRYFAALTISLMVMIGGFSLSAAAQEDEYWLDAGQLIQAGDYTAAIEEIDKQLLSRPDDVILLRFKGMCLIELGRSDEAVSILQNAIEIDPGTIANRYYLAQAFAYRGSIVEAIQMLKDVQQLAPESQYAGMAMQILPNLENLEVAKTIFQTARRWDLTVRTSVEYDDNVSLSSREDAGPDPNGAFRYVIPAVYFEYRLIDQNIDPKPFTLGGGYSLYQSLHGRPPLNGFRLTSQNFRLFYRKGGELFNKPYQLNFDYNYTLSHVGGAPFSYTNQVGSSVDVQLTQWLVMNTFYNADFQRFKDTTQFPEFFSRDGTVQNVGGGPNFYLFNNKLILSALYYYSLSATKGVQFDQNSHNIALTAQAALPWKIRAVTGFNFQQADYYNFAALPQRDDDTYTISVGLSRPIWKENLYVETNYSYTRNVSDQIFADYKQNIVSLSLNYYY